jgi:rhodanese-related sulfurtransferase
MIATLSPTELHAALQRGEAPALLDVREQGEFNAAHIPSASSMPRRLLEARLPTLVPWPGARLVLYDDDGRRAALAARTAERMGYRRVEVLAGGLGRWASQELPTEWGMNVPSKDFGERVEVEQHVPTIEAVELERRRQKGERLLIVDTRTPEEFRQACIPGGRNLPGGELAYRIGELLREAPDATIVVNCAGRTRSIIGTRTLQRMGLANVVGLRNGTQGWVLAGLPLEHGSDRLELPEPSDETRAAAQAYAARVAAEDGVRYLPIPELQALLARRADECVYLIDVRTGQEFSSGHIPGFWWMPGGQAVQRLDDTVAVRTATVVFCCDDRVRSTLVASWYRQLGLPAVFAVAGGVNAWEAAGLELERGAAQNEPFGLRAAVAQQRSVESTELSGYLRADQPPLVMFVDTSREFAAAHLPGSRWLSRSWLELRVDSLAPDRERRIVVTDSNEQSAPLAAAALSELGYTNVSYLVGGLAAWRQAGLPIEQGLSGVMTPPDDVVPAGTERSPAEMVNYLRWEEALGRKYARSPQPAG